MKKRFASLVSTMAMLIVIVATCAYASKQTEGHERLVWTFDFRQFELKNKVGQKLSEAQAIGDEVILSPAVALDGTVYFVTKQKFLYAVDPKGHLKWVVTGKNAKYKVSGAPLIGQDGSIYLPGGTAFYPDGSVKWSSENFLHNLAMGTSGTLYGTSDYNHVVAIDSKTGKLKWSWTCPGNGDTQTHECFSYGKTYPVIGLNEAVYVASQEGQLFAIAPSGQLKWKFQATPGNRFFRSGAIGSDGTIYIGEAWVDNNRPDAFLYAITPDGNLKWKFQEKVSSGAKFGATRSWSFAPSLAQDGTLFFGLAKCGNESCAKPMVYAIKNGAIQWTQKTYMDIGNAPALGDDGSVYVGSKNTLLWAFSKTGKRLWRLKTGRPIVHTPLLLPGGVVYVASDKLYAVKTDSSGPAKSSWPRFAANLQNTGNVVHRGLYEKYTPTPVTNPLLLAAGEENVDKIKTLLGQGVNVNGTDQDGTTALMRASQNGNFRIAKILLKKGADINKKNAFGNTAMIFAKQFGHDRIAKLLLEHGDQDIATPETETQLGANEKDMEGNTALYRELKGRCNSYEVKKLLKAGADVKARNERGKTALMEATVHCKDTNPNLPGGEVPHLLLDAGADIHAKDSNGETALFHAVRNNNIEFARLLIKLGADTNVKNKKGQDLLDIARKESRWENMIQFVEENID